MSRLVMFMLLSMRHHDAYGVSKYIAGPTAASMPWQSCCRRHWGCWLLPHESDPLPVYTPSLSYSRLSACKLGWTIMSLHYQWAGDDPFTTQRIINSVIDVPGGILEKQESTCSIAHACVTTPIYTCVTVVWCHWYSIATAYWNHSSKSWKPWAHSICCVQKRKTGRRWLARELKLWPSLNSLFPWKPCNAIIWKIEYKYVGSSTDYSFCVWPWTPLAAILAWCTTTNK